MLILTRKEREKIMIGDDIIVCVVRIDKDKVRIGIDAPTSIPIHRQEIWEEKQNERTQND